MRHTTIVYLVGCVGAGLLSWQSPIDGLGRLLIAWALLTLVQVIADRLSAVVGEVNSPKPTEIAPCPNPECGQGCHVATQGDGWTGYVVTCNLCQYQTSIEETPEEAIRVHHLICGRAPALAPFEKLVEDGK